MRYAIVSKGLTITQVEAEVKKVGAKDIREAKHVGELFCELDEGQASTLAKVPGLVVKPVRLFQPDQQTLVEAPGVEKLWDVFTLLRSLFEPPLTGTGLTAAVLDSGVRKSHESLKEKVVYEANFTESASADDILGHGTQVAFVAAGGLHGAEMAGVSPGAALFNIKVISDQGVGTEEDIVMGVDRVCELAVEARTQGLYPTDPLYPNVINLSLGAPDDGDPDNPLRVACRQASIDYGLDVVASAGNDGPKMTTIKVPATDPEVIAVGGIQTYDALQIWEKSSRGPTEEGETKPDFVLWGTDIEAASHLRDDGYVVKSGTSFSAPMLSGLTGLLWESGRRAYGEQWLFRWTAAREFAPYFCVKPDDAPIKKGNTYGYGLPAMGTMLGQIAAITAPVQEMMEPMLGMFMMLMIVGMIGGVVE